MSDVSTPSVSRIASEGVDRKNLNTIKERFLQVNNARLERAYGTLSDRQRIFLDILPLLFHVNHPMLPGYISHNTPFGISFFSPEKAHIQTAQRLARSFEYRFQPPVDQQIHALYLMGSCGTVAQSDRSDFDIWVCHDQHINQRGLIELQQKADAISEWALTLGVEAHCFLMNSEAFKEGERKDLSGEDCGSSQHYLLLDEFYRTGLLIAGKYPIWWLSPPDEDEHYQHYVDTLRDKRFINPADSLDFGGITQIPAGEFIGAGIWQLYKGIDSPYKSVLKILLSEIYADQYPNIEPLSRIFKRAIYNNQLDIDELDPYVIVFRQLENYLLKRNELNRLELVRRCFYFKVGKALTKPSSQKTKSWQRNLLERLTSEWQWTKPHLLNLDARDKWKINRVISEQKDIVRELTNSYRFLLDFARRANTTALINSQDMTVLGRKLYAAFERKAGKVEWINPGISANLAEDNLCFYFQPGNDYQSGQWGVSAELLRPQDIENYPGLKYSQNLTALLTWCHFNGLLDEHTRCNIVIGEHEVSDFELTNIIRSLRKTLPIASQYTDHSNDNHDRFYRPMRPTRLQLYINIGTDPLGHIRSQGIERLSDQTDSLRYSGMRDNLIINIEQVVVNSWGELSTENYEGESSLLRCIKDYLQLCTPIKHQLPELEIFCFCASRATAITQRIETLFKDLSDCFFNNKQPLSTRYLLQIQHDFYIIQFFDQQPTIENTGNYRETLEFLGNGQSEYSPIKLDRYCAKGSPLSLISKKMSANNIQVFYFCREKLADVYIIDERGSLSFFNVPIINKDNFLIPMDLFLQSTRFRQNSESPDILSDSLLTQQGNYSAVEYFEIKQASDKSYTLHPSNPIHHEGCPYFFNVQAIVLRNKNNALNFTIYCDQQEFSEQEFGDNLFDEVAKFILKNRQSKERYPCYITDLDLSRSQEKHAANTQTSRYLYYKKQLEQALNFALQKI